jgi:hypothetical protein
MGTAPEAEAACWWQRVVQPDRFEQPSRTPAEAVLHAALRGESTLATAIPQGRDHIGQLAAQIKSRATHARTPAKLLHDAAADALGGVSYALRPRPRTPRDKRPTPENQQPRRQHSACLCVLLKGADRLVAGLHADISVVVSPSGRRNTVL